MPRKHLIASKINSKQQSQAKILQKLSKEIKAAAKVGGVNPEANPRLKLAIEKALKNNLSRDSIERNIHGNQKNEDLITYHEYELFAPENSRFIITALTDNVNRTLSNLKGYINKFDGQIAKVNAVKVYFKHLGIILLARNDLNQEQILNGLDQFNLEEILEFPEGFEVQVSASDFYEAQKTLKQLNYDVLEAEIKWVSADLISASAEFNKKIQRFLEQAANDDDIQNVFSNLEDE